MGKFNAFIMSFQYLLVILKEIHSLDKEDWVYVRCPCNVGLISCLLFSITKRSNTWFKYAGNWNPPAKEPFSYTIQRYILKKKLCGGTTTINGEWPQQEIHLKSFLNPCLSEYELNTSINSNYQHTLSLPVNLLFVGRIESQKGIPEIISIAETLRKKNIGFKLTIIGEGSERPEFEQSCTSLDLTGKVEFIGELPHSEIPDFYKNAHFLLFPSSASEGWPKVISEAMAYGCVPIASDISSIPSILDKYKCGLSLPVNPSLWAEKIIEMLKDDSEWKDLSSNGQKSAKEFTYETYIKRLKSEIIS